MKLDPVLIDTRNYFGRPSYGFPWSRLGERPRIHVPYQRFQNVSEDFWEPIVPRNPNGYDDDYGYDAGGYHGDHQRNASGYHCDHRQNGRDHHSDNRQNDRGYHGDYRGYEERSVPITVERNPRSLSKPERKYVYKPYDVDDDEEEQIKLACRLSLANQNNNGTDVRKRRSHSGSRNQYEPTEMSQSPVHRDVIEIEDEDDAPLPPPRTTSLMSNPRRSNQHTTYRENARGGNWNLSDDSDTDTVISLVEVTPKVTRYNTERNPSVLSKQFYICSSDESDLEDCRHFGKNNVQDSGHSGKNLRYDYYKGMEKQDEDFCKLMRIESGDKKLSKGEVTPKPSDINITPCPSYPAYHTIREMITTEGRQVDYIHGDGNCFFRALSKVIYGSESCHEEIRQAVVDIMEKYPKEFEQFIDTGSTHEHIINMRKLGTWGTQAEIYGAATLLQRDVYILSPDHTGENYRWLLFSPRFLHEEGRPYHNCYLTLCHTNGNHYDRIAPLQGECNCHLPRPRMSGIRAQIDLTGSEVV